MENPNSSIGFEAPFPFPPFRRRPLRSHTSRTLLQFLSAFYAHPQLLHPPSNELQSDKDGRGRELALESEKGKATEHVGSVNHDALACNFPPDQECVIFYEGNENIGFHERGFSSSTQMVANEMENMARIEEKDAVVDDSFDGTDLQDTEFGEFQRILINEFEDFMKGNEKFVCDDNGELASTSLRENESSGGGVTFLLDDLDDHFDLPPISTDKCGQMDQKQVDERNCSQNAPKAFVSSVDKSVASEVLRRCENSEEKNSLLKMDELEIDDKLAEKAMRLDTSVCVDGTMGSPGQMIEDGEVEEGEISGKLYMDNRWVNICSKDPVASEEKKVDEKQVSEDIVDKHNLLSKEKDESIIKDARLVTIPVDTIHNSNDSTEREAKRCLNDKMVLKRKVVVYGDEFLAEEAGWDKQQEDLGVKKQKKDHGVKQQKKCGTSKEQKNGGTTKSGVGKAVACFNNLATHAEKLDGNAFQSQEIASKGKDVDPCNKRKRGPRSEESKAKKKRKKQQKRAEKNRELGVRRLKLRPVLNPKPVTYCRHYLKGRCHEGEKCKFSHDTTPLTKSTPCCHFARKSCMKGDDCPFDHQLSKYPCDNYVSKGFCTRGEACMFSHKLPPKEDSPSASHMCAPSMKSPGNLNSKNQFDTVGTCHLTAKASPSTGVMARKNVEQNGFKSSLNSPVVPPKGLSFLSAGKPSMVESSNPKQGSSSLKRNEGVKDGNQTDQNALNTPNADMIPKETPRGVAPKGINFLSFGKASLEDSGAKKSTGLPINQGDGAKLSLLNPFSMHNRQDSSPLNREGGVQVGKLAKQRVSNTTPPSGETLKITELAVASQKPNIFVSGESSIDGSRNNSRPSFLSSLDGVIDTSVRACQFAPDEHQMSSLVPFLRGSAQSTPKSVQKAQMSTLAFAAQVKCEMKINQSTTGSSVIDKGS